MKKYQIEVKGLKLEIVQDNDGKFVTPDIVKEYEKVGSSLKPSFEPIIVARKPFKGSLVDNVIEYGVGGINIDECRVGMQEQDKEEYYKKQKSFESTNKKMNIYGGNSFNSSSTAFYDTDTLTEKTLNEGRFPANTILTYDETDFDEVCGGFPNTKSVKSARGGATNKGELCYSSFNDIEKYECGFNDSGSASRYFYCAKASKKDRDDGLDEFEEKQKYYCDGRSNSLEIFGSTDGGRKPLKNIHPTVKPTELMQYLVRLVSPNGATILDPFNGSGSTGKAVMYENKERNKNYKYIGIELTEEYLPIAKARIEYVCNLIEEEKKQDKQLSIFDC